MKQVIRLTESDLHRIVKESVNRIVKEEWESPLDKAKKNKNNFDNVKKLDLSKFPEKKSKKPKSGTFSDLPSSEKLKKLKFDENSISRIVKESVNRILNETISTKVASKKDAIDYINGVFDMCEELKDMGNNRLSVRNIYPYENVYRKYYSKWVDAINHNYPRKRDLLLDLLCDCMVYRRLDFQEIESIFNSRYGN